MKTKNGKNSSGTKGSDSSSNARTAAPKTGSARKPPLRVNVGQEQSGTIEITNVRLVEHRNRIELGKFYIVAALTVLFGGDFVWLTYHAISTDNQRMIEKILDFVTVGLVFVAVFATGKAALKILSAWKTQDLE